MRLTSKVLLGFAALLGLSHAVAVTMESQVAAQLSWLLIFGLVAVALAHLAESAYGLLRGEDTH